MCVRVRWIDPDPDDCKNWEVMLKRVACEGFQAFGRAQLGWYCPTEQLEGPAREEAASVRE